MTVAVAVAVTSTWVVSVVRKVAVSVVVLVTVKVTVDAGRVWLRRLLGAWHTYLQVGGPHTKR